MKTFSNFGCQNLSDNKKIKYCDHLVVNENKTILKENYYYISSASEIFLDTETTGLSFKEGHKVVEIACIETKDLTLQVGFFTN